MTSAPDENRDPQDPSDKMAEIDRPSDKTAKIAQCEMAEIDRPYMEAVRKLLLELIRDLGTDISEIAEGLILSRTVVSDLLDGKKNYEELRLSIGRIFHLHKILSDTERVDKKRRSKRKTGKLEEDNSNAQLQSIQDVRERAKENRTKFKENGLDRLLIAAGFQPVNLKMLPVLPEQYPQLAQIIFLSGGTQLEQDLFFQITKQQLDLLIGNWNSDDSHLKVTSNDKIGTILKENLKANQIIIPEQKDRIIEKYDKFIRNKNLLLSHQPLTNVEHLGLFTTILLNELTDNERMKMGLRVTRYESIPLSISILDMCFERKIREKIESIKKECEEKLYAHKDEQGKTISNLDYYITSVNKTLITCECNLLDNDKQVINKKSIKFEYISSGTNLATSLSSISLSMGFQYWTNPIKFEMKTLASNVESLVKTTIVIGDDKVSFQGDWVGVDLMLSAFQATIIAGEKWLYKETNGNETAIIEYKKLFLSLANIRDEFDKIRDIHNQYKFDHDGLRLSFIKLENQSKKCIDNIANIYQKALPLEKIFNTFLPNFYRINILSKIHRLQLCNIQGSLTEAKSLIKEIDELFVKCSEQENNRDMVGFEILHPSRIMFETEKLLYNLSSGCEYENNGIYQDIISSSLINFFTLSNQSLEKIENENLVRIKPYLQRDCSPKAPGLDIYQSLAYSHSIIGRWLLYLGQEQEELDKAFNHFLKAAYYFSRIGFAQRSARNIALAGRARVRSQNGKEAKECKELAEDIVKKYLKGASGEKYNNSMFSEINLLDAEYDLIITKDYSSGLKKCLQGLKGALWLGLNRRIADNLYTVSCFAKLMSNENFESLLRDVFPELWEITGVEKIKQELTFYKENKTEQEVIELLVSIQKDPKTTWNKVAQEFNDKSAQIWHRWYQDASGKTEDGHPIGKAIKNGDFLKPLSKHS